MEVEVVQDIQNAEQESHATHLSEHSYSKLTEATQDRAEPMDTSDVLPTLGAPTLTALNESQDTFETFLLLLLRTYTRYQREGSSVSTESRSPGATTDTQIADISPEALNTLSSDQVQTLVTSNSVNYDVIQQIMAQKQQRQSSPGSVGSATEEAASMATTGPAESENKAGQPDVTGSMQAPVVHITPEQLKQLQIQVSEAFRSQQLSLQQELSQQQQQQLIQSLLLRQLHLQQVGQRKESSAEESATSPTQAPPQRTLAGLLKEGERATAAELQAKSSALQAKNSPQTKNGSPEANNGSPKVSNRSAQNVTQPPLQQQNQPIPTAPPTAQLPSQLPAQVAPQPIQLPSHHPLPPTDPRELPSPQPQPMVTQQARHISQGGIAAVVTAVNPSLTDKKESLTASAEVQTIPIQRRPSPIQATLTPVSGTSAPVTSMPSPSTTPTTPTTPTKKRGRPRREKEEEPKKPPQPFDLFLQEVYSTVLAANPQMSFVESSRIIAMMWNAMGDDVKQKYVDKHEKLKEDYRMALEKYNASLKFAEALAELKMGLGMAAQAESQPVQQKMKSLETHSAVAQQPKDPNLCVNEGCTSMAVFSEDRGRGYCSNECVFKHSRNVFHAWLLQRKTKA